MFESKMTTKSAWGQVSSINSSCAPGFIPIPCPSHQEYSITNICKAKNCIEPLCPQCIAGHVQLHQQSKIPARIQNIITTKTTCIEQLAIMKYEAQKQIEQSILSSIGNIQQFVQAHQKRLDIAYKKIIKIVDDLFADMNKQMQVISNAYLSQKQKRQKEAKMKLSPMNDFLVRITEYKQQLQSEDYIPALIQLLNQPPKKPKYQKMSEVQNYGSVEINQKCLQDIKTDITKFVKVIVNCKDEGFKGRVEMNKTHFNGSNNMKFSRFDRQRSKEGRDGSSSKLGQSSRSNSRRKIFGNQSVISRVGNQNTISHSNKQISIQQTRYSSYSTPLKITKSSYFLNSNTSLWYFKQGTKNGFRAPLQSIQAGFQKIELNINFLIPQNHKTIILPNGTVFLLGGESINAQEALKKVYRLNQQDLTLKEVEPMLNPRSSFGICYLQGFIYVAGGLGSEPNKFSNKRPLRQAQRYNLTENRWQKICQIPQFSYQFSMNSFSNGKIIKFGGLTDSRVFVNKIDIYEVYSNHWITIQPDSRFLITSSPGIAQISNQSLIVFGGKIPANNEKISKCYILTEQQKGSILSITEGPELYNQATFQCGFIYDGTIIGIQNNDMNNRNKLIMGFKYDQWKFISC